MAGNLVLLFFSTTELCTVAPIVHRCSGKTLVIIIIIIIIDPRGKVAILKKSV